MSSKPQPLPSRPGSEVGAAVADALERGDRRVVLTHLMSAHGAEVLRFCTSMLRDPALAEDVRQTVFIDAYQALGSYDGRASLRTWLFGIARHRCLDAAKSRRRWSWRFWLSPDAGERELSHEGTADHAIDQQRRLDILLDCLRGLPSGTRVVLLLRYEEGLAYEEIARISRERAATVQARVARALPVIRECVEGKGVEL